MPDDRDASAERGGHLSAEELITLNEEIAAMARAGLPLDQGLAALARDMGRGRLRAVTRQLAQDLHSGFSLPRALARQEGRVPPFYAALLDAGVRSGRVGDVLTTLTLYARAIADFRTTVVSAVLYPAIVLALGLGLLAFVASQVLPAFVDIFHTARLRLPLITQLLILISDHVVETLVLPVVVVGVIVFATRSILRTTPQGRSLWARLVYAVPLAGDLIRSARLAAFADLLGILVDRSIPLPQSLRLAADASSDPLLTVGAEHVEKDLRQGQPLGAALKRQRLVPTVVVWMIAFGERQGTLGPTLHQVAQLYRHKAEIRAAVLRTVLPPLLILALAAFLGLVFIFGLMGPMFALLRGLSGG